MTRPSTSRVPGRARAAGVSATALALLGALAAAAPSAASPAKPSGPGVSGWWYDALVVEEAHRETTGEGATVIVADGTIDTSVPELQGADIRLEKNCMGDRLESFTVPDAKHGTEMAALIVGTGKGTGPGGAGIAGIAPDARLHYYSLDYDPSRPGISCSNRILPFMREALASADGGAIVNWSVGNLVIDMKAFQREVEEAGGVSVAAAGDRVASVVRGQMDAPALYPGYVAVMALDESAEPWVDNPLPAKVGRTYEGYPTISAPGVDIPSLEWRDGGWTSGGVPAQGTSYATALVSGSLALVKSKYPEATGNQLIQHLIHFDTDPDTFEYSDEKGFGIVSLRNMLANDPTGWPDVNPILDGHPRRVIKKFPMSVHDPERARDTAEADATGAAADEDPGTEETDTQTTETAGADTEGGVPVVAWVGGAVVVLLLLGGAVVLSRRARTSE